MAQPKSSKLTLIFMGTSAFGIDALRAIHQGPHDLVRVYSQPPRPAGRGHKLKRSAIHDEAHALGIEVKTPASLKSPDVAADMATLGADLAVVASYGLLLPRPILATPRLGAINLHASILPRWRGAAPIQRAIMAGDKTSGVSIFQMEEGLDTGPVYQTQSVPIRDDTTSSSLHDALAACAATMLPPVLDELAAGTAVAVPQDEDGAIYAKKILKTDGKIDFSASADDIDRKIRALNPWPGCFAETAGERLNFLRGHVVQGSGKPGELIDHPLVIACGDRRALVVELVKRPGRNAMAAKDLQNGMQLPLGTMFS